MRGVIARIVRNKGFAFVKGDDGIERFFHSSAVRPWINFDGLAEEDVVTFDEDRSPKGPRAKNIDIEGASDRAAKTTTAEPQANRAQSMEHRTAQGETEKGTRAHRGSPARGVRPGRGRL